MSLELKTVLGKWSLVEGYISNVIRGMGGSFMAKGSSNAMLTASNFIRAFRGVTLLAGKLGSRLLFNTDQSYAGLGTATTTGTGNVFNIKSLLAYIGAGQVNFAGLALAGIIASNTLSYVKKSGGVYAASSTTGPFQAGHAQPSAPTIYAKTTLGTGQVSMSGAVSVVIWRISSADGQPSIHSLPSNVVTLTNQSVIVQFPLPDTNGQTHWGIGVPKLGFADLGVFYELPTSSGGEVAETALAYTRVIGSASIADTTQIVNAAGGAFTSADIGRRIAFSTFDSWITAINSPTQVQVNDTNSSGGTLSGTGTITHAVQGITRAVEVSWANGYLINQNIAPEKAFPPPPGQFAGVMNDTVFLEADGIIYVGDPGYIGSFPPSNALFPNEPAVHYLRGSGGMFWRWGKHSLGVLFYVGGSPALEYQVVWENVGIEYPQNTAIGANGRVMAWLGKPAVMGANLEVDEDFDERADLVASEFAGWDAQLTPVCPGYDPTGKFEVWCYQKKVMAYYVPKRGWCAPIDLTGKVSGNIVDTITINKNLYLSCSDGATLSLYQFDAGTGSVMVVQTDDINTGYADTITEVSVQGRADNILNPVRVEIIKDFNDSAPVLVGNSNPLRTGTQHFVRRQPNILNVPTHAVRVTMTSTGGDAGVELIQTSGARSEAFVS